MPAEGETSWPADAHEVGRVIDAWGVKGWIKVQPFSSDPQALFAAPRWFLRQPEDREGMRRAPVASAAACPSSIAIRDARMHGEAVVAWPAHSADRTSAEALRGARIFVSRSSFPASATDEYYWVDLIGLAVENRAGEALGTVIGLLDTGPQSVLRIRPAGASEADTAHERLIPFVAAFVDQVDMAGKRIVVDWGLDF